MFGVVLDIVKYFNVFDCDLYVFDILMDEFIEVVELIGMLLYGFSVDLYGNVFVV